MLMFELRLQDSWSNNIGLEGSLKAKPLFEKFTRSRIVCLHLIATIPRLLDSISMKGLQKESCAASPSHDGEAQPRPISNIEVLGQWVPMTTFHTRSHQLDLASHGMRLPALRQILPLLLQSKKS